MACKADAVALEDVVRFDHQGRTFAIYRTADDKFYATDGFCTHEQAHLAEGFVMGTTIECPKHNGRFDFRTGKALCRPVRIDLGTYPVKVEDGQVFIDAGPSQ